MYLASSLVELSFNRLSARKNGGKTPLERTSALMYFLAFDATAKKFGNAPLDFNPQTLAGKNNRDAMALEFVRIVQLHNAKSGRIRQISVLGKIEVGGTSPEKRISSNFFTVPLKKATQSSKTYFYPNRPAPVIKMGSISTGTTWGIDYCDDWKKNLPKLLSDTKSNTPFTDLAVFVLRGAAMGDSPLSLREALSEGITRRFSERLAAFWMKQVDAERVFLKHANAAFQEAIPAPFSDDKDDRTTNGSSSDVMQALDKEILINRILYLEGLLDAQEIEYQPITN